MIIIDEKENEAALVVIRFLMDADPEPESPEGVTLQTLAKIVQGYEKKYD